MVWFSPLVFAFWLQNIVTSLCRLCFARVNPSIQIILFFGFFLINDFYFDFDVGFHISYSFFSFSPALVQIAPPGRQSVARRRVDRKRMVSWSSCCSPVLFISPQCAPYHCSLCLQGLSPLPAMPGLLCSRGKDCAFNVASMCKLVASDEY